MKISLVVMASSIILICFGLAAAYICINTGLASKKEEERELNNENSYKR